MSFLNSIGFYIQSSRITFFLTSKNDNGIPLINMVISGLNEFSLDSSLLNGNSVIILKSLFSKYLPEKKEFL